MTTRPWTTEDLYPLVYDELMRGASRLTPGRAVDPEAMLDEARRGLRARTNGSWSEAHFVGTAARAARSVLVDRARRGGPRLALRGLGPGEPAVDVLVLDDALAALEIADPEGFAVVEVRLFSGLGTDRVAEALALSPPTAERRWRRGRAWLAHAMAVGGLAQG